MPHETQSVLAIVSFSLKDMFHVANMREIHKMLKVMKYQYDNIFGTIFAAIICGILENGNLIWAGSVIRKINLTKVASDSLIKPQGRISVAGG